MTANGSEPTQGPGTPGTIASAPSGSFPDALAGR